ncbi:MAG: hypothetical protein GX585_03660 [Clostridiales bacterium]|nr:hypothetical protein [Clostridiales bacterium]
MKSLFLYFLSLLAGVAIGLICGAVLLQGEPMLSAHANQSAVLVSPPPPTEGVPGTSAKPAEHLTEPTPTPDLSGNRVLLEYADQAALALREEAYVALSSMVHPVRGITFTPYSTVDEEANLTFTAAEISNAGTESTKFIWGLADGSGNPIQLTMADYFEAFVYNADYLEAPVIGVDQVMARGNSPENVAEAYPDARFVEYHFPGLLPENQGFDWCSLKLVFELYRGSYKLVGIVHSQWTI